MAADNSKKIPGRPFSKGKSPNPGGRPKLPEDVKAMKEASLAKAIEIMHSKVNDSKYVASLRPAELQGLLEIVFDRCGLPKVSKIDADIQETRRIVLIFPESGAGK